MQIQCIHCGKQYSLRDENVGSQFACRSCGKISPLAPAAAGAEQRVVPAAPLALAENGAALVETQCLHCGKQYKLKPQAAGMQFKCKQCGGFSPVGPAAAHGAKIAPAVRARPAAAKPRPVEPLMAVPVEPLIAVPVEPPRAIPLKSGPAPLAVVPLEPLPSAPSDMLDLLNEAQSPSMASPYAQPLGVGPEAARPLPPKTVGRQKRKRKSAASDQPSVLLRILGGAAMMAIGLAFAGFAAHALQRPGRIIVLGVCVAAAGFKLMLGLSSDD